MAKKTSDKQAKSLSKQAGNLRSSMQAMYGSPSSVNSLGQEAQDLRGSMEAMYGAPTAVPTGGIEAAGAPQQVDIATPPVYSQVSSPDAQAAQNAIAGFQALGQSGASLGNPYAAAPAPAPARNAEADQLLARLQALGYSPASLRRQ